MTEKMEKRVAFSTGGGSLSPTAGRGGFSGSGDLRWPPRGWPMFACITRFSGSAVVRERAGPAGQFLRYDLSVSENGIYTLEVVEGCIGPGGTSLVSGIGISFTERDDASPESLRDAVRDIHVRGQSLIVDRDTVLRSILAITYLVSRIDRDLAPGLRRVLKIYRLG